MGPIKHDLGVISKGEIKLGSIRWQLQNRPLNGVLHGANMLLMDKQRFVTYFSLLARV